MVSQLKTPYRERAWRKRASDWEREKFWFFCMYLGGDSDDPPRIRLQTKPLHAKYARAHMPARHIYAPIFGLRRRYRRTPSYVLRRKLRESERKLKLRHHGIGALGDAT